MSCARPPRRRRAPACPLSASRRRKESFFICSQVRTALAWPGALILVDKVVRDGALVDDGTTDSSVLGVRRLHELLSRDDRVSATTIQIVGAKGYDGMTLAIVNGHRGA